MSKLKVALAVRTAFKIAKWVGISVGILTGLFLLWLWANAHFVSFAIIVGVILAFVLLAAILTAIEWSDKTIKEAEAEERKAQERSRIEKLKQENPDMYVPDFEDDHTDPYSMYR